ncbi:hypothetical protein [Microbispora sp. GKU 823]|uniref:hypothetical protein n=1 Tax=Microbispora sp. GKU 823 TaxID=1652100 RepID=UPI00117C0848|nr:hypothetical protein [Microbispora sp. GKU 823]
MALRSYIEEELAGHAIAELTRREASSALWRPKGWLYEGTVRAELYRLIANHKDFQESTYTLLAEQSYGKTYPESNRADLMLFTLHDEDNPDADRFIIFEVKSEFDKLKIDQDVAKLLTAADEFQDKMICGYMFYCVPPAYKSWEKDLKQYVASNGDPQKIKIMQMLIEY